MVLLSVAEIARHNSDKDCWIIIKGKVYDVSNYLDDHPGGVEIITDLAGQDSTEDFEDVGHSEEAYAQLKDFYIGDVGGHSVRDISGAATVLPVEIPVVKSTKPVTQPAEDEENEEPAQLLEKRPEIFEQPVAKPQIKKVQQQKQNQDDGSSMLMLGAGLVGIAAVGYFLLKKKK